MKGDGFLDNIDSQQLEQIVQETIKTLEKSREAIYSIAETAREEEARLNHELAEVRTHFEVAAATVDKLEKEEKKARLHLMEVSRNFNRYGESEMQAAYEKASQYQLQLGLWRERETQLRRRRDQLEIAVKRQHTMVQKAAELATNLGTALALLTGRLARLGDHLDKLERQHILGLKILQAQEEERQRLAREIHDGPAQAIASIALKAELCSRLAAARPQELQLELSALTRLARDTLREMRKIIFTLRPMMLDDLGLVPALYRFAGEYKERFDLDIDLTITGNEESLDKAVETGIFRLIQEALNNVWKHAGVTEAEVRLEFTSDKINLLIKDRGCGFNTGEVTGTGYGLAGMQERVRLMKGQLWVKSIPGQGTEVKAVIPRLLEGK